MSAGLDIRAGTEWFQRNEEQIYKSFSKLLSFASISTDSAFNSDVIACSKWVEEKLQKIGFSVEYIKTPNHPILLAKSKDWKEGRPTLLIYNHYDVQPIDPLELWNSPPFEPKFDEKKVIARGAQDNKGQLFYVLTALEALYENKATLGWNLIHLIEGEEECGSEGLYWFLKSRGQELLSDGALIVDLDLPGKDTPGITLGMRGLVSIQVTVTSSSSDLHSGMYGGIALNPAKALTILLANLFDEKGVVKLKGFYEGIEEPTAKLRELLDLSFDQKQEEQNGVYAFDNALPLSKGISLKEANWFYPTLEINGIHSGYGGKGVKTIIPAKAEAKISCRLVKGQDANLIATLLQEYFIKQTLFPGLQVAVEVSSKSNAVRVDHDSPIAQIAANAYSEVFGKKCQYRLSGASVPVVAELAKLCSGKVVLMGMGLPEDGIHAPNESFGLERFRLGFEVMYKILQKGP